MRCQVYPNTVCDDPLTAVQGEVEVWSGARRTLTRCAMTRSQDPRGSHSMVQNTFIAQRQSYNEIAHVSACAAVYGSLVQPTFAGASTSSTIRMTGDERAVMLRHNASQCAHADATPVLPREDTDLSAPRHDSPCQHIVIPWLPYK